MSMNTKLVESSVFPGEFFYGNFKLYNNKQEKCWLAVSIDGRVTLTGGNLKELQEKINKSQEKRRADK